jgi:hypothetical protein
LFFVVVVFFPYFFFSSQTDTLQWAHANGCPWDGNTFASAAHACPLEVLKWLRQQGCPLSESAFTNAACRGDVSIMEWLLTEKCPCSPTIYEEVAGRAKISVLRWMHSQHVAEWTAHAAYVAACRDSLEVLQLIEEIGCDWRSRATEIFWTAPDEKVREWVKHRAGSELGEDSPEYRTQRERLQSSLASKAFRAMDIYNY